MNRRDLAAEYLLGELDDAGRARVEGRLAEDAELRAELEAMRPLVSTLESLPEDAWPASAPSGDSVAAVGEREGRRQAARSRGWRWVPGAGSRRWSVRPALALATLLVVAALGVGLGALLNGGGGSEGAPAIVLRPLRPAAGEQATVAMPAAGEMLFHAEGLPPLGDGHFYELWLMTDASRTVPVASFRVGADGRAIVRVPLPADPSSFRYFDVSQQRVGAGTGHSAVSVLRGPTT